jgi:pyruvate/2-oxoglutarate dehydrogenase complex dihydrolipoamide dehydrogenase (E3) component
VLATGSDPLIPPIPGLAAARPWTNRDATSVEEVPKRVVVLGGGPVGCEMSQALHALGAAETTVIVRDDRLLARHEPFAGELLAKSFRQSGIGVHFGRTIEQVERQSPGGPVVVRTDDGMRLEADEILVATGRQPVTADIGLETVGLKPSGPLAVDDSMRVTAVPDGWLYAVGDVNGRNQLTHMGKYQARVCGDVIAARAKGRSDELPSMRDTADARGAPQAIFTDPQICSAGRTEARARADGYRVRAETFDIGKTPGAALQADGYTGQVKGVLDEDRKVLLGVTVVGPAVVDHLHALTIAVTAEVPLDRLWHAVPAFPTVSEFWLYLLEQFGL